MNHALARFTDLRSPANRTRLPSCLAVKGAYRHGARVFMLPDADIDRMEAGDILAELASGRVSGSQSQLERLKQLALECATRLTH